MVLAEALCTANGSEELMFVLTLSFPTPHLPGLSSPAKICKHSAAQ